MKLYDVIRQEQVEEKVKNTKTETFKLSGPPKKKRRKRTIFMISVLIFMSVLYMVSLYFVRVKIYVQERTVPFSLEKMNIELPHETKSDTSRLSFQTMVVTTEITRDLFGSEIKEITGKAKGSVIFFNEYSKNTINIKNGTKLTAQNGKTYLTQSTVTIPGYKLDGKKKIAGTSTSVAIIATETGSSSNSEGTSFVVSGYQSQKTQIYARSAGSLKGGEAGMKHTISDSERPQVIETLKTQLVERLKRETRAQIPETLITYPDLQFISIDTDSLKLEGEGIKFPAFIKGTMVSYLIPRDLFETVLSKEALSQEVYTTVSIPNIANLSVSAIKGVPVNPGVVPETIVIQISGEGSIITKIPEEKIQNAFIGIKKSFFDTKISEIPEIAYARYKIFPFWAPVFPKEQKYIKIFFK